MRLALLVLAATCASAQTQSYTYGLGCGGGGCNAKRYATAGTPIGVFVYVSGGGGASIATTCPPQNGTNPEICAQITDATNHGYEAYAPSYTLSAVAFWPAQGQDLACFFSDAIANNRRGNWNNVILAGESFGAIVMNPIVFGPLGKYLTDSNANCPTSNTAWQVVSAEYIAGVPDFLDATSGYCVVNGGVKLGNCQSWFGNSNPLNLRQDASATFFLSSWAAKGFIPRVVQLTGSLDSTVPPATQNLLGSSIAAIPYTGPAFQQITVTGYGHPVDDGTKNASDSWPSDLTNTAIQSGTFCNTTASFPSGYPLCGALGYVGRAFDLFLPRGSASGGSGMSGGSQ